MTQNCYFAWLLTSLANRFDVLLLLRSLDCWLAMLSLLKTDIFCLYIYTSYCECSLLKITYLQHCCLYIILNYVFQCYLMKLKCTFRIIIIKKKKNCSYLPFTDFTTAALSRYCVVIRDKFDFFFLLYCLYETYCIFVLLCFYIVFSFCLYSLRGNL